MTPSGIEPATINVSGFQVSVNTLYQQTESDKVSIKMPRPVARFLVHEKNKV
jgi:hypothetical protein